MFAWVLHVYVRAMVTRWTCDDSAMRFRWGPQRRLRLYARMGRGGDAERCSLWPGKRLSLPLILLNGSSMPPHLGAPENLGFLGRAEALVARWLSRAAISHCDSSAECECKGTAFFWHGNGLSWMLWGLCPLTCTMLRMHNPFYGLSPLSLSFYGCLWKSVSRVCMQPERDEIYIFEKRKLFTFYMYSFLDS